MQSVQLQVSKMSKANRETEYKRLVALGRHQDICQSLKDEFEPKKPVVVVKAKPVKVKKEEKVE